MPRKWTYRDYTGHLDERSAKLVLGGFCGFLFALEIALRLVPPHYSRPNGNSMHGDRTIMQDAADDSRMKLLLVGDSTVVGGGVSDPRSTFAGLAAKELKPVEDVFNLGVPAGSAKTNCVELLAANRLKVPNIDRVVIQVSPAKLLTNDPSLTADPSYSAPAVNELESYLPEGRLDVPWLPPYRASLSDKVEYDAEYQAGRYSRIIRARDYVKTKFSGGFPAFWIANLVLPSSFKAKLFSSHSDGNNRLAANPEDGIYQGPSKETDFRWQFVEQGEYQALRYSIELAKQCSSKPPVVLIGPIHYNFNKISDQERQSMLSSLAELKDAVFQLCGQEQAQLVWIDSTQLQQNELWTRSFAHYRPALHEIVWQALKSDLIKQ